MELLEQFSNRPDVLYDLEEGERQLLKAQDETTERVSVRSVKTPRRVGPAPTAEERLGEQNVSTLLRQYRDGTPAEVLAERFGVSLSSVRRLLRRHGVDHRMSQAVVDELVTAYRNDPKITRKELATKYHIGTSTVDRILRKYNVRRRQF